MFDLVIVIPFQMLNRQANDLLQLDFWPVYHTQTLNFNRKEIKTNSTIYLSFFYHVPVHLQMISVYLLFLTIKKSKKHLTGVLKLVRLLFVHQPYRYLNWAGFFFIKSHYFSNKESIYSKTCLILRRIVVAELSNIQFGGHCRKSILTFNAVALDRLLQIF